VAILNIRNAGFRWPNPLTSLKPALLWMHSSWFHQASTTACLFAHTCPAPSFGLDISDHGVPFDLPVRSSSRFLNSLRYIVSRTTTTTHPSLFVRTETGPRQCGPWFANLNCPLSAYARRMHNFWRSAQKISAAGPGDETSSDKSQYKSPRD